MGINKFQIDWQVSRLLAKEEKDLVRKIHIVDVFLQDFPTKNNYIRVKNWANMLKYSYGNEEKKKIIGDFQEKISKIAYKNEEIPNNFAKYEVKTLKRLLIDLKKRSYSFFYKGNIPKDHIKFVEELTKYCDGKRV